MAPTSGTGDLLKKLLSRSARLQLVPGPMSVLCAMPGNCDDTKLSAAWAPSAKNEYPVVSADCGFSTPAGAVRYSFSWPLMSSGVSTSRETLSCASGMSWPSQPAGATWPYAPSVRIAFWAAVA